MTRPQPDQIREMSQALLTARSTRTPIAPLTDRFPDMTVEDAYAVQQGLVAGLLADGDSIIGYKLGLTSKPMQEMLGVDQPDYAPVLGSTVYPDGGAVQVMPGKYGPYVKWAKVNATLPKEIAPEAVTLEEALALIAEKAGKPGKKGAAKKAPVKKAVAKNAVAKAPAKAAAKKPGKAAAAGKASEKPETEPLPESLGKDGAL